ncbi:hypothetical protein Dimus_011801 [Dionaea muscipula]
MNLGWAVGFPIWVGLVKRLGPVINGRAQRCLEFDREGGPLPFDAVEEDVAVEDDDDPQIDNMDHIVAGCWLLGKWCSGSRAPPSKTEKPLFRTRRGHIHSQDK